ncbi:ArsR/SmtB family transcription factor [Pseudonocardia abyssalis]|uniref:ArsR family transcriptional regulator n=1 Tax=Pseudonocardia abyssalis TaxID=2792008 RepID=A0ABS6UYC7_9PSEU|nr:metalloregulator ArsR/SmtB family transcription factor [Pseudonocardia abyssalis]MBW0116168.1 ArsR family transcriptional regulator [Pseudonocardia abyssalis]MBW0137269.1 ArsR family transcriptional regulator [Pseudonocardia abyssalis]
MGDRSAKTNLLDELARVGKALGSGTRLELLDLLTQGPRSVADLAAAAGLGLTTTSAHLQTLRRGGLVTGDRDGTTIRYRLSGPDVAALLAAVRAVATVHLPDVVAARDRYLGLPTTDDPARDDPAREEIGRDELLRRARAGEIVVLDVRPRSEYRAGHIPGAVSIPADELADRLDELPDDVDVVAYCRGAWCVLSHDAVRLLTARGHRAYRLVDGMLEWRLDDRPVEVAAV